jgi:hypothetical protein
MASTEQAFVPLPCFLHRDEKGDLLTEVVSGAVVLVGCMDLLLRRVSRPVFLRRARVLQPRTKHIHFPMIFARCESPQSRNSSTNFLSDSPCSVME